MIRLPVFPTKSADFSFDIVLNRARYTIRMVWNIRTSLWYLHVTDEDGGAINGVAVVSNWPLLSAHRGQLVMDGNLVVIPRVANPGEVDYSNLASEWQLVYMTPQEESTWVPPATAPVVVATPGTVLPDVPEFYIDLEDGSSIELETTGVLELEGV